MLRLNYYRRIFAAYLLKGNSQLTFWHDHPGANERAFNGGLGEYYQDFSEKARYGGPYDPQGVPLMDYHGRIGRQYNPIALAQGQGISALIRAHLETEDRSYLAAAERAFEAFKYGMGEGGVAHRDENGSLWLEEYLVDPPSHILNGFIWALWGIYDFSLFTGEGFVEGLFQEGLETLEAHLSRYDAGFWSLYDLSPTRLKTLASPFYHRLHIVQLEILYRITGREVFRDYSQKWADYTKSPLRRNLALFYKGVFKLLYY